MIRQLTVDVNRVVEGSMIRANAGRAVTGTELEAGQTIVVGDDGRGVVLAEVVELDHASGSMVLRLMGELVDEEGDPPTHLSSE
jgi:hypothetical protein